MPEKVGWLELLNLATQLLQNPEQWEEFKTRFSVATLRAALELAKRHGIAPEHVATLERELAELEKA